MNPINQNHPARHHARVVYWTVSFSVLGLLFAGAGVGQAAGKVEYNRDIRPILAENCFACHGPDSASRKAGLRLDQREVALKKQAIVPGKLKESELVRRIHLTKRGMMPPASSHKKLSQAQKELLQRWIEEGAEYQPHWSYLAPKRPALSVVKNKAWVRNPIDAFILAKLEANGLTPAPEADRRTLARRLSLDLTGLPPAPADVDAFVKDTSPNAYEKFVDKLMQSAAWGEHRGRYWLDAARYADTHGLHFDNFREMWAYRDWVIDAFNRNLPFDQFTIEQLAGDLLPARTLDQLIASGFNRCNITTNEGGTIPEENLVLYTRDRTETVAAVWLGLTANCAVCHDHKFDTFSTRDFYSMAAFFNNSTQGAMDGNIRDTPPKVVVPRREDRARWDLLSWDLKAMRDRIEERKQAARPEFDKWLTTAKAEQVAARIPTQELRLHAPFNEGTGKKTTLHADGKSRSLELDSGFAWTTGNLASKALQIKPGKAIEVPEAGDFEKNQGFSCGAWVKIPRRGIVGALAARMDNGNLHRGWDLWMENDRVGMHVIHRWPDDALKVVAKTPLQPGKWYHVLATYDGSGKAGGVRVYLNGVLQPVDVFADKLKQTIRTKVPLTVGQRHTSERLKDVALQDLRLYGRTLSAPEVAQLARSTRVASLLTKAAAKRTPQEINELFDWWLAALDLPYRLLNHKLANIQQEEVVLGSRGTIAHVMQERSEEPTAYILYRGEYDKRRDLVKAATPKILPPMPEGLPRNRLGFARWLLQPEHPLTARVTVNRFWQEVFGTGLVRTTGDFGVSGELPSHPELLDWLAVEFRETGWDVKKFFKLLVTSSTYRQSAAVTKEKLALDPHNTLLSRGPRYRLDAEMVRDYALAASGLLVRKLGGPSVKPYQPEGVWEAVAMIGSNTRDYRADKGEKLYRRSLYTFWKRGAPPASMDILNAPSREFCTVRRERTNTPLQALVTLNDPQFVEAARHLAELTLKQASDKTPDRLDFMAKRLLARPLRVEEVPVVREVLDDLLDHYKSQVAEARKLIAVGETKADPSLDVPTLAAWTMVANQLMNLDEVLNK
jgi:hypothetical protein